MNFGVEGERIALELLTTITVISDFSVFITGVTVRPPLVIQHRVNTKDCASVQHKGDTAFIWVGSRYQTHP